MIDRSRLTERVSPSLLRLELRRSGRPLVILAVGLVAAAAAGNYILGHIRGGVGSTHTMRFEVADATGVVPGRAEVRFKGIEAGRVTRATLTGGHAVLTVEVADRFGAIYRDARAAVRPNTALQDMFVDIVDRGTPRAGRAGAASVVPLAQTESPVNLAGVLNLFRPGVRAHMHQLIDQLGNGLHDRGAYLRRTFTDLVPFLRIADGVSRQLAARADLTRRLVHDTGSLSSVLATRSTQLRELVTSGTRTLEALATGGGVPLQQTIHALPPALEAGDGALSAVDRLLPGLDRAITTLGPAAAELRPRLADLRRLAVSADPALRRLRAPVRDLGPLATQLQPLAAHLSRGLGELRPQVPDVDTFTKAWANCTQQFNEFLNWDASMSKFVDPVGHMVRGNVNFGFYSVPTVRPGSNFVHGTQCSGRDPIGGIPTPKLDGPPPAP